MERADARAKKRFANPVKGFRLSTKIRACPAFAKVNYFLLFTYFLSESGRSVVQIIDGLDPYTGLANRSGSRTPKGFRLSTNIGA